MPARTREAPSGPDRPPGARAGDVWRPAYPPDPLAAAVVRRARSAGPARGREDRRRRAAPARPRAAPARPVGWAAVVLPALTLFVVIALEVSNQQWTIRELAVLSPMVAATLAGPRLTTVYAVAAVATALGLGWYGQLDTPATGGWTAQIVRLGGVAIGGVMAILASRYNTGRETTLANVSQVAEVAQRAILADVPAVSREGLRLAVRYESATAGAMVGGDLYEVVDSRWGTRLLVGDARGKGLDAVRLASRVLGCFRVVARGRAGLREVLPDLDAEVAAVGGSDDFVTGVVAELGARRLALVNAGHPDPLLWRRGRVWPLAPPDRQPPLGLGAGAGGGAALVEVTLEPGDQVLFYTDGIAEARERRTGAFFPLLPAAEHAFGAANTLQAVLADLVRAVEDWTGSALRDDVALLAVQVPAGGRAPPAADQAGSAENAGNAYARNADDTRNADDAER
ncbi:serine/threonine-protein phosphatase [Frankia sp. CNm7]|uniref:Serine/threonine-protein phosphatase n=2 Tax=Frankia nepalensis TaxID=1836974 RepID=A0A937ULP6_9ACTN|nr:PP2C family protein-serine/threonine phosphatase [Frankia nepalensis]MBL7495440.1 serine/threonine-protein phosphatase [Frankia nepalensis]MBL7522679.1 serine/threonine-protein phosphatase [Frankia nepalensis]MBL7625997.1 serine/threonine-protein phosphatase [Frankia nepalensis]